MIFVVFIKKHDFLFLISKSFRILFFFLGGGTVVDARIFLSLLYFMFIFLEGVFRFFLDFVLFHSNMLLHYNIFLKKKEPEKIRHFSYFQWNPFEFVQLKK